MGDPRKLKKHYERPKQPYQKKRIEYEKELMKKYGLRRKKEIWKAESMLREIRRRVRDLIATKDPEEEKLLLRKVAKMGLAPQGSTLDNILDLKVENVLERRLQTLVARKGLANTPLQARQFIVHGHVEVDGNKVTSPSYFVDINDENKIALRNGSPLKKWFRKTKPEKKEKGKKEEESKEKKKKGGKEKNKKVLKKGAENEKSK